MGERLGALSTANRELVSAGEAAGVRVRGLDDFLVSTDGMQPLQEIELDVEDSGSLYDATREFLSRFEGLG